MKKFIDIVEDIKDIVSSEFKGRKIFDKDIADMLGITRMNFATMKKRNKIPFQELLDFCAQKSIAINWILYGQSPESLIESTNKLFMVKYYNDVNASAGGGSNIDDESFTSLTLEPSFVASLGGERELKNIEAINVTGDSMEPTFSYGDVIFINRSKTDIKRGGVFTINTESGLFIKRVQVRLDGSVDIISDNKDYPIQTLNQNDFRVVGRVVGRFGRID